MNYISKILILLTTIVFMFSGCFVGKVVSLPIKAVGAITPGPAGTAIGTAGDAVDILIPF